MKTRYMLITALITGALLSSGAQSLSPDRLLEEVQSHNITLQTAWESFQASVLEAGTGNTPPDPEVVFGYMFGTPDAIGNKINFNVVQQLDFPTVYIHRARLKEIRTSKAGLEYLAARQEILLHAKKLWIERIHLNQMEKLMARRLRQAELIHEHFRQMLNSGEVAQLAFSQSTLQLAELQDGYEKILAEIRNNSLSITEMTGGTELQIRDTLLPVPSVIQADSLLGQYLESPDYLLHQAETELKAQQKNLAVSETLPRLSAGYISELFFDKEFKGVQVGLAIPLWENANRIKQANAEIIAATSDAERYSLVQQQDLLRKLELLGNLRTRADILQEALRSGNTLQLLTTAVERGEISMAEYFYASDYYFRSEQQLLQLMKEHALVEADLLKIYL